MLGTPIQNALVVHAGATAEFTEVNSDLQILDANSAFWHSVECEAKINVGLPLDRFGDLLDGLPGDAFSFGPLAHSLSYERHFLLRAGSAEVYVSSSGGRMTSASRRSRSRKPGEKGTESCSAA